MASTVYTSDFDTANIIEDFWAFDNTQANNFNNGNGAVWKQTRGTTPSNSTGPSDGQNADGYVYIETSSPHNGGDWYTMTTVSAIDFTANTVDIDYWYNMNTGVPHQILVEGWDGSAWVAVDDITPATADLGNVWVNRSATFDSFINSDGLIRFKIVTSTSGTSWQSDVALDTITITVTPKESDSLALELITISGATRVKLGKRNKFKFPGKSSAEIRAIVQSIISGTGTYDFANEYKHGIIVQESQNIIHVITKKDRGL